MAKKVKYYVVWHGVNPGIYRTWAECQAQIKGFPRAQYKSFDSLAAAEEAYREPASTHIGTGAEKAKPKYRWKDVIEDSISVDAACSGNPGIMEYRGVHTGSGDELFHQGPFDQGTNNIGEFLAIVHALGMLTRSRDGTTPIYTDSETAMSWMRRKKARTTLKLNPANAKLLELVRRAETWLQKNTFSNKILKWNTAEWGEIPADFGRK